MKQYTIPKGRNYSREWWRKRPLWKPTGMRAILRFDPSMIYKSENDGWQKLCGFSRGHHHDNSFRFVWRIINGFFQIGAYQYVAGVRTESRALFTIELIKYHPSLIWDSEKYGRLKVREFEEITAYKFPENISPFFDLSIELHEQEGLGSYRLDLETPVYFVCDINNLPSLGYTLHPYYEDPKSNPNTAPHDITFQMEVEYF